MIHYLLFRLKDNLFVRTFSRRIAKNRKFFNFFIISYTLSVCAFIVKFTEANGHCVLAARKVSGRVKKWSACFRRISDTLKSQSSRTSSTRMRWRTRKLRRAATKRKL